MNTRPNVMSGSTIEEQIRSIQMSEYERNAALHAASVAEAFVEVFTWAGSKFNRPSAGVFANPSPKY